MAQPKIRFAAIAGAAALAALLSACASTDRISATITGTSQQKQVDLAVAAPIAQALEFVSATPDKICLAGSGCEMSSVVSFRLKDQDQEPDKEEACASQEEGGQTLLAFLKTQ